jgi:hypothetical protein
MCSDNWVMSSVQANDVRTFTLGLQESDNNLTRDESFGSAQARK